MFTPLPRGTRSATSLDMRLTDFAEFFTTGEQTAIIPPETLSEVANGPTEVGALPVQPLDCNYIETEPVTL